MVRSWKLSQLLSALGLTTPVIYFGTLTLAELQETQIELWDSYGEIEILKPQKLREIAYTTLTPSFLFGTLTLRKKTLQFEQIQKGVSRWTTSNSYGNMLSVTAMLPSSKGGRTSVFVSITKWFMDVWQYLS